MFEHQLLTAIHKEVTQMAVKVDKLAASEARLKSDVDRLLALVVDVQTKLVQVSADLANATNPADAADAQAKIDALVADLDAESAKVEGVSPAPAASTGPTGSTGAATAATGPTGASGTAPAATGPTGATGA